MNTSLLSGVYQVIRPFGRRRLVLVCLVMALQAVMQFAAVFSLAPFLAAATDPALFRASLAGELLLRVIGPATDAHMITVTGLISLGGITLSNAVSLLGDYTRAHYAFDLAHFTRMRVLHHVLSRRYEFFLSVNSAQLLKTLVDDVSNMVNSVVLALLDLAARSGMVLLLALALLIINPPVMLVAALAMAVYAFVILRPIRRRAAASSEQLMHWVRGLYTEINQVLVGIKPVLATSRMPQFVARVAHVSRGYSRVMPRLPLYGAIPRSSLEVLAFGGIIVWVLTVIHGGGNMIAMLPQVGVIGLVAYRLMPLLQAISSQTMNITSARQALDEVLAVFASQDQHSDHTSLWTDGAGLPAPLLWNREIRFDNVSFAYAGAERAALRNINLTIPKGAHVAFVGPTGSGKSTLIDLLMGLLAPTSGQILIDGKPLEPRDTPGWRRSVGYVPQDLFLYDATIAENIAFGHARQDLDEARVRAVAAIANATEFIERPGTQGFDTLVGERGVRLSGGQRQRLALARALHDQPNLLVLDEATSALDGKTEKAVVANLGAADEQLTVVSITHRLATIRHYDRIHMIRDGEIVASGSYAELEQDPHFREFAH